MADSTPHPTPPPSNDTNSAADYSFFQRMVCLYDWWLIVAKNDFHGKRLAVAGVSSKKDEAVRVFVSAPIIKRYDVFSLETADGIYVMISGFINKQRTLEHGFAPEVFNSFLFGFPPNWESYALDCFREVDSDNAVPDIVPTFRPEILSDGNAVPENESTNHPEILCNAVPENESTNRPEILCDGNAVPENESTNRPEILCDGNAVPENESTVRPEILSDGNAVPDNVSTIRPEILTGDVGKPNPTSSISPEETLGNQEKPFHKDESNESREMTGVSVAYDSGGNRRKAMLRSVKVCQKKNQPASGGPLKHLDKEHNSGSVALENRDEEGLKIYGQGCLGEEPTAGIDVDTAAADNLTAICPDMFNDAEKSLPTSLVSPQDALEDCQKPFPERECHALEEIGGVNVAYGSCGNRHSARLHNIESESSVSKEMDGDSGGNRRSARLHRVKVNQLKNQPASDGPPKHPDREQSSHSVPLENCNGDELKSPVTPIQSQAKGQVNILSEQVVKKSSSRISSSISAETAGHYKKKRMTVMTKASSPKRKITKSASAAKSLQERDLSHSNSRSKQKISCVSPESLSLKKSKSDAEKSVPTSLVSPQDALGDCQKPFPEDECNVLNEIGGVNVAYGSRGNRHSARLHNIEGESNVSMEVGGDSGGNRCSARLHRVNVSQQKNQPASDGPLKHPGKEPSSQSVALENRSGDGLKSPVTPIQPQSKGLVNILSEQVFKKSASRISSSMSAETAGHYKKRRMDFITKAASPKRKITKSASVAKSLQERDSSHSNSRSKQKISCVSPESLSLKKSKSGRLLLPSLEFWRNQVPVYNMYHEVKEIQEGASVVSPYSGASPSLSRNWSNKNTKVDQQNHINAADGSGDVPLKRKRGRQGNTQS